MRTASAYHRCIVAVGHLARYRAAEVDCDQAWMVYTNRKVAQDNVLVMEKPPICLANFYHRVQEVVNDFP